MKTPVSIVCPDSFVNNPEVELVISDNASQEGTEQFENEYLREYNNIVYYKNSSNEGVNKNIYYCLKKLLGCIENYVMILFHGWVNKKILDLIKKNEQNRSVFLFTNKEIKYI
jgi:hypothetical protein